MMQLDMAIADEQEEHREALFDTEPSPQPQESEAAAPAPILEAPPAAAETKTSGPAPVADDIERPLDPRYVELHKIIGGILTACLATGPLVALLILWLSSDLPGWAVGLMLAAWAGITPLLAWWLQRWPAIEHRHHSYRVNEQRIEIRSGVVWRKVITVPRSRIQHTDVAQGPIERRFGLATLRIHTAGTENAQVDLPGLDHATALRIRDHLVTGGEDDAV